jgi:hypothetical protein
MFTNSNSVTDFLFTTPNFLSGAGTVINLGGSFYDFNKSSTPDMADMLAIKTDFNIVGNDLKASIDGLKINEFLVAQ